MAFFARLVAVAAAFAWRWWVGGVITGVLVWVVSDQGWTLALSVITVGVVGTTIHYLDLTSPG